MQSKVYRSGPVATPAHPPAIAQLYARLDALRPAGRLGRGEAIFCAPSLFGVSRWYRANLMLDAAGSDVRVREVRLAPTVPVFVYSVDAYERASRSGATEADIRAFWATGIRLETWLAQAARYDPRAWEVLVPAAAVLGTRPVADQRVIDAIPTGDWTRAELIRELKRHHRAHRA